MSRSETARTRYSTSDYSDTLTDDPRNCRVDGCHKKHAYVTLGGVRIYSKFCYRRMCLAVPGPLSLPAGLKASVAC